MEGRKGKKEERKERRREGTDGLTDHALFVLVPTLLQHVSLDFVLLEKPR